MTLDGVLLGGTNEHGTPIAWRGRVEVDDAVLSQGDDPIVALSVANASGTSTLDGLPLHVGPRPDDGLIDVAIAVPVTHKPLLGKPRMRYEVRRASGRAVAVTPHEAELPFLDDGVAGALTRKRSWWIEPGAWSVYTALAGGRTMTEFEWPPDEIAGPPGDESKPQGARASAQVPSAPLAGVPVPVSGPQAGIPLSGPQPLGDSAPTTPAGHHRPGQRPAAASSAPAAGDPAQQHTAHPGEAADGAHPAAAAAAGRSRRRRHSR